MKPDSSQYNPDPAYLRELIAKSGLSQRKAADQLGITDRVMRKYLADRSASSATDAPYVVQFCLGVCSKKVKVWCAMRTYYL